MNFLLSIALLAFVNITPLFQNENEIKEGIISLAHDIESKQKSTKKDKIAILQFRTSTNTLTRFNHFIQDQLHNAYNDSKKFEVIDQSVVNMILETTGWSLDVSQSFRNYTELSDLIFRNLGIVPDGFIYGNIEDNGNSVSITFFYYPNGLVRSNTSSTQTFYSNEFTDRLLGKSGEGIE